MSRTGHSHRQRGEPDYVASTEDHYQPETTRDWPVVVDEVRSEVQRQIDANGSFVVYGHSGVFVCQ